MSRGLGRIERRILDVLKETRAAGTETLTWQCGLGTRPQPEVVKGVIEDPDPADVTAYKVRQHSVRRALRSLRRKGLVVAVTGIERGGRAYTYMLREEAQRLGIVDDDS